GNYEQGWAEYEWRWRRKKEKPPPFREPLWDGSSLSGRTILFWMEQGLGDMLQFIRYAPLVKEHGGRVLVVAPRFLLPLLGTCQGIDTLFAEGAELEKFDVHAPLMSLPFLLKTTLATVPAEVPYLAADPQRLEQWREKLADVPGFRVGIAWQGNPHHKADRH